jgi:hypothetical protein
MPKTVTARIGSLDFSFEHSPVKIVANRNCPEINLVGLTVGPFEEGNEYEVQYWIARELEKAGIVRVRDEEVLDSTKIFKIQWKERVQTVGQISKLQEDFYPKLRRYLVGSKKEIAKQPEKVREYEKVRQLVSDITNSRLKKIVSLASAPAQTEQVLKNLTSEEKFLYEQLYALINKWRTQILEYEGEEE